MAERERERVSETCNLVESGPTGIIRPSPPPARESKSTYYHIRRMDLLLGETAPEHISAVVCVFGLLPSFLGAGTAGLETGTILIREGEKGGSLLYGALWGSRGGRMRMRRAPTPRVLSSLGTGGNNNNNYYYYTIQCHNKSRSFVRSLPFQPQQ